VGDVSRFAALATSRPIWSRCAGALNTGRPITVRHTGSEGDFTYALAKPHTLKHDSKGRTATTRTPPAAPQLPGAGEPRCFTVGLAQTCVRPPIRTTPATWGTFPLDVNRHVDLAPVDTEPAITPQPREPPVPPGHEPTRSLGALTASSSSSRCRPEASSARWMAGSPTPI